MQNLKRPLTSLATIALNFERKIVGILDIKDRGKVAQNSCH